MVGLPVALESGDCRGGQVRGVLAQQGGERLLEVAGRNAAQVEHRQERVQAPGPSGPARQDLGGEADPLASLGRGAVAHLHPPHLHRADAGLEGALGTMPVTDEAGLPVGEPLLGHRGQEGFGLRLDRLRQQPPCAGAQHGGQWVIDRLGLRERDDGATLVHGVSLSWRGSGRLVTRLDTPPSSDPRHPHSAIALVLGSTALSFVTLPLLLLAVM